MAHSRSHQEGRDLLMNLDEDEVPDDLGKRRGGKKGPEPERPMTHFEYRQIVTRLITLEDKIDVILRWVKQQGTQPVNVANRGRSRPDPSDLLFNPAHKPRT